MSTTPQPLTISNGKRWILGLVNAVISGGASAVTATVTVSLVDPKDWSVGANATHFLELVGFTFAGSALVSLFKYLAQNPIP